MPGIDDNTVLMLHLGEGVENSSVYKHIAENVGMEPGLLRFPKE